MEVSASYGLTNTPNARTGAAASRLMNTPRRGGFSVGVSIWLEVRK